jgi:alpha-glucosidase/alpha-D-xyloside xylohydrolase
MGTAKLLLALTLLWAAHIVAAPMRLEMAAWNEQTVRIRLAPAEQALAMPAWDESSGFLAQPPPVEVVKLPVGEGQKEARLGAWRAVVTAAPFRLRLEKSGRLVQELGLDEPTGALTFALGHGPVLGLGEGAPQFDRRGELYLLKNGQVQDTRKFGARIAVPLLIGTEGWALFIHTPAGDFDLRGKCGMFQPKDQGAAPGLDLLVIDASDPAVLMAQVARLTGAPALPPKWALGYMQSHRTLENTAQMLNVADTFRQKKLPCDAVIYLGTGFCPAGWNTKHDSFEFNPKVFTGAPGEFIKEMHARYFHVVLHAVPPQVQLHGSFPPAAGETVDAAHIASYWARHHEVFALGVDG